MDGLMLLLAGAESRVERREFVGIAGDVTPDMLAQIDWNDKSTRGAMILAVNIACIVLIVIFVTARLIVRRVMTRQFFLDDTLVTIASAFTIGLCVATLLALKHGFGQHVWNFDVSTILEDIKKCVQLMFVGNIFYCCAITFTKLSIIVSYLRIFPYNRLHVAMYITAAVTVGLFIASVPATIFQCSPVSAAWDFTIKDAHCYKFVNFLYASTAINVTTDLVLCAAPLPYFWNLQLPRKQKIIVSFLFFIGGFACVASIVRLTFLNLLSTSIDVTWHLAPSVLWTIAECGTGICCVSVPPMRPLYGKLLPNLFLSRRTPYNRTGPTVRRQVYAMGSWPKHTPTEEENTTSEADLTSHEQVPASWLASEDSRRASGVTVGRKPPAMAHEDDDVIEEPEPTWQKT